MSANEGPPESPSVNIGPSATRSDTLPALCPYLVMIDGDWRRSRPDRDHRCTAVAPPVQVAADKQRRLCLVAEHTQCATYGAAAEAHPAARDRVDGPTRPVVRTTPVVLDHRRLDLRVPPLRADHVSGQAVLVGILGIALVIVLFARPGGTVEPSGAFATASSPQAVPSAAAPTDAAGSSPAASPIVPTPPAPGGSAEPTGAQVGPSPSASPSQRPATSGATYRVRSGDTLSAIAARFGTTAKVLADLNGINDPSRLQIGRILQLP